MNSYFDEKTQTEFRYEVGAKVICRDGFSSDFDVDLTAPQSSFYPVQGQIYTVESVYYSPSEKVLYLGLLEDKDFKSDWYASRFIPAHVFMQG